VIAASEDDSKRLFCCNVSYVQIQTYIKVAQIGAAVLLLVEVIFRFVWFLLLGSLPNYVLTFYFLFFAFYLIGFELGIKRLKL
jgi:hypothetical protein